MPKLKRLGAGATAIVYALDGERALKCYFDPTNADRERHAYERVGSHPNIVRYLGTYDERSLIFERGELPRLGEDRDQVTYPMKVSWLKDIAEAMKHLHGRNIVHADIGCHNVIIVDGRLKLIDLGGCGIDGGQPMAAYEWFSSRELVPEFSPQSDIFAYGCMVYEILTGKVPYHEYEQRQDRLEIVAELYAKNQYPDVRGVPLGTLMTKCWSGDLKSMSEVIVQLELETKESADLRTAVS